MKLTELLTMAVNHAHPVFNIILVSFSDNLADQRLPCYL